MTFCIAWIPRPVVAPQPCGPPAALRGTEPEAGLAAIEAVAWRGAARRLPSGPLRAPDMQRRLGLAEAGAGLIPARPSN